MLENKDIRVKGKKKKPNKIKPERRIANKRNLSKLLLCFCIWSKI